MAEATQTAVPATQNRNLSTSPKRMAVIKVWDAMMRGARKYWLAWIGYGPRSSVHP